MLVSCLKCFVRARPNILQISTAGVLSLFWVLCMIVRKVTFHILLVIRMCSHSVKFQDISDWRRLCHIVMSHCVKPLPNMLRMQPMSSCWLQAPNSHQARSNHHGGSAMIALPYESSYAIYLSCYSHWTNCFESGRGVRNPWVCVLISGSFSKRWHFMVIYEHADWNQTLQFKYS